MRSPSVAHRLHSVPRAGADTTEDAAAVRLDDWPIRGAVADGATESIYAGPWADRLVRGMVETEGTPASVCEALAGWQDDWRAAVQERAHDRPWYVQAKAETGAFATILGLSVRRNGTWRSLAVGDSCLFHVRGGEFLRSWPVDTPEAFSHRPALVPSRRGAALPDPATAQGTWQPGDAFLLATDALAAWILGLEQGADCLRRLLKSRSDAAIREIIRTARADGTLRNDDATLLVLEMNAPAARSSE